MQARCLPLPDDDQQRLEELRSYHLDASKPEAEFLHIAQQAADTFAAPMALVSFVEEEHQFFKAMVGFDACSTRREDSFCTHTILGRDVLVIPDTHADGRFPDSKLVTGEPFVRFYAGAPIMSPGGFRLGSVCVLDTVPRPAFSHREERLLQGLARIVVDLLDRRRLALVSRAALRMATATPDAIVCSDERGMVIFWNRAAERIFGFSREEAVGAPLARLVPNEHQSHHHAWMKALLNGNGIASSRSAIEVRAQRRDGTQFPAEVSVAKWKHGDNQYVGTIIRDLSERNQSRERVRYLTHHDRLTDLPNRTAFLEHVDKALRTAGRFTLFKVGLDRFKAINGSLGMAMGDLTLVDAGRRVRQAAGPDAFVARLAGDEFGILLAGSDDPLAADATARQVLAHLERPFYIAGATCHLGASIGIVLCPGLSHFDAADAVLKAALLALMRAKAEGGRRHAVFTQRLGQQADERRWMEEELRGAFIRGEFELHFQPQVTLPDAHIVGAEALLRWRHPSRGLLSPAVFLPVLEASGICLDVGRWIVRQACSFAGEMTARGVSIRVGVNLFAGQLNETSFFDDVTAALALAGVPGDVLELEITETTVLGLDESTIEPLHRLRAQGIGVAFDDYGTGYASLSLLKRYPLTRLKIDRAFVRDIGTDPDDAAIVRAVIALGASLGLDVIAEGIETAEQASALAAYGCPQAQGYRFGKPMPAEAFRHLLTTSSEGVAA